MELEGGGIVEGGGADQVANNVVTQGLNADEGPSPTNANWADDIGEMHDDALPVDVKAKAAVAEAEKAAADAAKIADGTEGKDAKPATDASADADKTAINAIPGLEAADAEEVAKLIAHAKTLKDANGVAYKSFADAVAGEAAKQEAAAKVADAENAKAEAARVTRAREMDDAKWEKDLHDELDAKYLPMVAAGELTREEAIEKFIADKKVAVAERQSSLKDRIINDFKEKEERRTIQERSRDHITRTETEVKRLIDADANLADMKDMANSLVRNLLVSLGPNSKVSADAVVKEVSDAVAKNNAAVEQRAVAKYIADEATKAKNAAPVVNAKMPVPQSKDPLNNPANTVVNAKDPRGEQDGGDWVGDLMNRAGFGKRKLQAG